MMLGEPVQVNKPDLSQKQERKSDEKSPSGPPAKKLKQAVLSFKKSSDKCNGPSTSKKRKLSQDAGASVSKAAKTARCVETSKDGKSRPRDICENEVSSSSETGTVAGANPAGEDKSQKKMFGALDRFVRTTQLSEVSTSSKESPVVVDLTDSPVKSAKNKSSVPSEDKTGDNVLPSADNKENETEEPMDTGDDEVVLLEPYGNSNDSNTANMTKSCSIKIRRISDSYVNGTKDFKDLLKVTTASDDERSNDSRSNEGCSQVDTSQNEKNPSDNETSEQKPVPPSCPITKYYKKCEETSISESKLQPVCETTDAKSEKNVAKQEIEASKQSSSKEVSSDDCVVVDSVQSSHHEAASPTRTASLDTSCVSTCSSTGSSPKTPASTPSSNTKKLNTSQKVPSAKKMEKELEKQKKLEEKEKLRLEKLKKKEDARLERERLKQLELEKKEQEKQRKEKERQEKKELLDKEKEEKRKQKEEEMRKKQEVIDAKNEEKRKKEDEKKKKEEEKQKEEDEKIKKKEHVQKVFKSFFFKSDKPQVAPKVTEDKCSPFFAFEVKKDMHLAPAVRVEIADRPGFYQTVDDLMAAQEHGKLYLSELKNGDHKSHVSMKRRIWNEKSESEIEIITDAEEKKHTERMRAKFLKFHENYRPAYYGTWRKQCSLIKPRNPFKKAEGGVLDYEVDSDEEWEEEEPGESLSDSEGEEEVEADTEDADDDEDADGFFVPHGYLSEGEGCEDDEEEVTPDQLKARQIAKARAWDAEMKKQCQLIKPIVIGCIWMNNQLSTALPDVKKLLDFKAVTLETTPLLVGQHAEQVSSSGNSGNSSQQTPSSATKGVCKKSVPESAMMDLIKLIHGNTNGVKTLIKEFREFWRVKNLGDQSTTAGTAMSTEASGNDKDTAMDTTDVASSQTTPAKSSISSSSPVTTDTNTSVDISKRQLEMKIRAIAEYEKRTTFKRCCWYVNDSVLKQYDLVHLPVPTQWHYLTKPNIEQKENENRKSVESSGRKTPTIAQFTVPRSQLPPERSSSPVTKVGPADVKDKEITKKTPTIKQFAVPRAQLAATSGASPSNRDNSKVVTPVATKPSPLTKTNENNSKNSPVALFNTPTSLKKATESKGSTPHRITGDTVRSTLKFSSPSSSVTNSKVTQPEIECIVLDDDDSQSGDSKTDDAIKPIIIESSPQAKKGQKTLFDILKKPAPNKSNNVTPAPKQTLP